MRDSGYLLYGQWLAAHGSGKEESVETLCN